MLHQLRGAPRTVQRPAKADITLARPRAAAGRFEPERGDETLTKPSRGRYASGVVIEARRPARDRLRRAALLVPLLLIASSAPANAARAPVLEPGVHVDPNSPAGKEYAIPLSAARGTQGGGGAFGLGITRPPGSAGAPRTSGSANAGRAATGDARAPGSSVAARRASGQAIAGTDGVGPAAIRQRSAVHQDQGAGIAWMLGIAALILALGEVARVVTVRARRRRTIRAG